MGGCGYIKDVQLLMAGWLALFVVKWLVFRTENGLVGCFCVKIVDFGIKLQPYLASVKILDLLLKIQYY